MKNIRNIKNIITILFVFTLTFISYAGKAEDMTSKRDQISQGKLLWQQEFLGKAPYTTRSCTSCHGLNNKTAGKHIKTQKVIKPMALSVTPNRFSKAQKVKKWFYRNCKWTIGRECSPQEQADILAYLKSL